ncbi:hypothetical protein KM043_000355 [Ampulex compressa]|nr:hypothetical protein KM043_000355 [Ampulex compressa]
MSPRASPACLRVRACQGQRVDKRRHPPASSQEPAASSQQPAASSQQPPANSHQPTATSHPVSLARRGRNHPAVAVFINYSDNVENFAAQTPAMLRYGIMAGRAGQGAKPSSPVLFACPQNRAVSPRTRRSDSAAIGGSFLRDEWPRRSAAEQRPEPRPFSRDRDKSGDPIPESSSTIWTGERTRWVRSERECEGFDNNRGKSASLHGQPIGCVECADSGDVEGWMVGRAGGRFGTE